jgi:DNA-binding MarR family transcriptional regulator
MTHHLFRGDVSRLTGKVNIVTGWLTPDEQRAWRGFLLMHRQLSVHLHRQLQADSGLSLADYEVLVSLTDIAAGRRRPSDLQRQLQWEQSRLSHHLTRMQRRGLVERTECPDDGRGAYVALTATGRATIEAAAPGHVEAVRRWFFDQLAPEQVRVLGELSDQVLGQLEPDPGTPLGSPRQVAPG